MKDALLVVVALTAVALCSAAAHQECEYRKSRQLPMHWANPDDCGRFYRCTDTNVKRGVVCTKGKLYDAKTGKCADNAPGLCNIPATKSLAEADRACNGVPSETIFLQAGYCRSFYVCLDNQAIAQDCDPGSYFDESTANCVPDMGTTCWQNVCLQQNDGAFVKNAQNCRSFYVCHKGQAVPQNCSAGSYFDDSLLVCKPGECDNGCTTETTTACPGEATTTPCPGAGSGGENVKRSATSQCIGGYTEGHFLPHPTNAQLFYICNDGKLVQSDCLQGNRFDPQLGACVSTAGANWV